MALEDFLEENRLRETRLEKNYRQWHLHIASGVALPRISQIENGAPASDSERKRLSTALGVSINDIWPISREEFQNGNTRAIGGC